MKNLLLIFFNYALIMLIAVIGHFEVFSTSGLFSDVGLFFFYDIPRAFDSTIAYSYNPNGAILFVFHLSIIPLLLGFIKNNKIIFFLMVVYLFIELIYIAFVSFIMGV